MYDEKDHDDFYPSKRSISSFRDGLYPYDHMPQAIAHRGLSARYPENTMASFAGAVSVGAHALETDLHLSRDGVVVLSHDATLKRCFGIDKRIIDCDSSYLKTLRTIRRPQQSIPTLIELLQFLALPENRHVWLLLDIKTDNIAEDVMKKTAKAIFSVNPDPGFWIGRINLGIWNIDFVPLCEEFLPDFPITYIGLTISKARPFFDVPGASFNMLFTSVAGPFGKNFLKRAYALDRDVFVWTINDKTLMRWAIQLGVSGVCTDDTELFLKICRQMSIRPAKFRKPLADFLIIWSCSLLVPLYTFLHRKRWRIRLKGE